MRRTTLGLALCAMLATGGGEAAAGEPPGGYLDEAKYPNIVRPDGQFGRYGGGAGRVNEPSGAAVRGGRIYVAECDNDRVQVFDLAGASVSAWGARGVGAGEFVCPGGIAVTGDGVVYVADTGNHRVQVFGREGRHLQTVGAWGHAPGRFAEPRGLAADGARLYVADTLNNRVQVFARDAATGRVSPRPALVFGAYGGAGGSSFNAPTAVAVDGDGAIYVADSRNNRIAKFDRDGRHLASWGAYGSHNGQFAEPTGVAFHAGRLYVADLVNHRIQVFAPDGAFVRQWGRHPPKAHEGQGRIHYPMHIAADAAGVVVCEPFEHRCQFFRHRRITAVRNVDDSAWWDKGLRFHYGLGASSGGDIMAVSEPDTHHVLIYDIGNLREANNPKLVESVGGFGGGKGEFNVPTGVTVDAERELLYVSDRGNRRIHVFRLLKRKEKTALERKARKLPAKTKIASVAVEHVRDIGGADGGFGEPGDHTLDKSGNLYVLDVTDDRIVVFAPGGTRRLATFGRHGAGRGEFNGPTGIDFDPDGRHLYVVEKYNHRLQKFLVRRKVDLSGDVRIRFRFVDQVGGPERRPALDAGHVPGFVSPHGVAVGPGGRVYVTDKGAQNVQVFDAADLRRLSRWGGFGAAGGRFYSPKGIAVDKDGNVIVMNFGNHRADVFDIDGVYLKSFGIGPLRRDDPVSGETRKER